MARVRKSLTRRTLAGVSAIALGLTGVLAASGAAFAAPAPGLTGAPDRGSLTITKYLGNPVTDPDHNGTQLATPPSLPTAEGVEFTIKRVGVGDETDCDAIDLTTPAGWDQAKAASELSATQLGADGYCLIGVTDGKAKTNRDGVVKFEGLDLGLYYVEETDAPAALNIVTPVKPFYVTIPYPSGEVEGENDGETVVEWTYDVFVYPKNATSEGPTKTIDTTQPGLQVGDSVNWTIEQGVPDLAPEKITTAIITDALDARLGANSVTVALYAEDDT